MDIADGALDKMFDIYRELLPTLGGYITEVPFPRHSSPSPNMTLV
jgi:5'-3' exonuclease